jgi:Tfp pilus assembly protein PilN
VNLIPQSLRVTRSHQRRMRRWGLACAVYAAALVMSCVVIRGMWSADSRTLNSDIASTGHRIVDANRVISGLRVQIADLQEKSRTSMAIADQPDWSILLAALSATTDDELVLREVRLGPAPGSGASNRNAADALWATRKYQLALRGVARSAAGSSKFVTRLEQMQFFDEVKLLRTSRETFLNGPAVGFEIECTFGQQRRSK